MGTSSPQRSRRVAAIALVAMIGLLGACSGGGSGSKGAGGSNDGGSDVGGLELARAPGTGREVAVGKPKGGITDLVQNVYYWSGDDNGDVPKAGTQVYLMFEPGGAADLVVENDKDALLAGGSWTYDGGTLGLKFATDDMTTDSSAKVDLNADEVKLPFRLLSSGAKGESTWLRTTADPLENLTALFRVATAGDDAADGGEATQRAADYANAILKTYGASGSSSRETTSGAPHTGRGGVSVRPVGLARTATGANVARNDATDDPGTGGIDGVSTVKDADGNVVPGEIRILWKDGPPTTQLLFSWQPPTTDPLHLSTGPLAGDPRTHLPTKPTGNTAGDPAHKKALFFAPIESHVSFSWAPWGSRLGSSPGFDWDGMASTLEKRGYDVKTVENDDATIVGLTKALTSGGAPGLVIINTHGLTNGYFMTRDIILTPEETTKVSAAGPDGAESIEKRNEAITAIDKRLADAGFGDLTSYKDANGDSPITTIRVPAMGNAANPVATVVGVGPAYWDYLREKKGVDLSKSLVYMAACLTDQSDLRDHVRAGSFWAFTGEVSPETAGAVASYVVDSVAKPSWSAEEAYYNTVRVVNTKQMAYKHDKDLDGKVPGTKEPTGGSIPLFDASKKPIGSAFVLNAYDWNGSKATRYAGRGWLDPSTVNGGQVWYMMWAARWGQDANTGAANLHKCYDEFWSKGKTGGLASPYCNAANAGSAPTKAEVDYATYLLTGNAAPAGAPKRWTLNESG